MMIAPLWPLCRTVGRPTASFQGHVPMRVLKAALYESHLRRSRRRCGAERRSTYAPQMATH